MRLLLQPPRPHQRHHLGCV